MKPTRKRKTPHPYHKTVPHQLHREGSKWKDTQATNSMWSRKKTHDFIYSRSTYMNAPRQDWTTDLPLTKRVLYHWAIGAAYAACTHQLFTSTVRPVATHNTSYYHIYTSLPSIHRLAVCYTNTFKTHTLISKLYSSIYFTIHLNAIIPIKHVHMRCSYDGGW